MACLVFCIFFFKNPLSSLIKLLFHEGGKLIQTFKDLNRSIKREQKLLDLIENIRMTHARQWVETPKPLTPNGVPEG